MEALRAEPVADRTPPLTSAQVVSKVLSCHTRLSEENQVHTYMHARIKFHAYSDI
jgi:hypothetical protein